MSGGWIPALRIARRSVRRNLARSLLVAVLVAVPVAGATMVDIVFRSLDSPAQNAASNLGEADAGVTVTRRERLDEFTPGMYPDTGNPSSGRDPASVDLAALLPAGSRVVPVYYPQDVRLQAGDRAVGTTARVADLSDPLERHFTRVEEGRAPAAPDEVLLTRPLAERLEIGTGATVTVGESGPVTVTGISVDPFCHDCTGIVAARGSLAIPDPEPAEGEYRVDLPAGTDADALWPELAAQGIALTPREYYLHPERYPSTGGGDVVTTEDLRAAALVTLVVGLGLLEVVLLAGTAFAVGARRQTRELGLVAASGGAAHHVRRIVLAQGFVLGVLGAVIGVAAGFGLAFAGRPLWESFNSADIVEWAFGPWEIAGAALVGVLSGLAAAVIPAIGAGRMRPVDALAERFRVTRRSRRRTATAGLALLAVGGLLGLAGDRLLADDLAAYETALASIEQTGEYVGAPSATGPIGLVVLGATLLVLGLVLLAPAAIGALTGTAARLPLFSRLAVRDAARHRHRTGPATSAIAMAVAGSVVLAFLLAGQYRAEELRYLPSLPPGVMIVDLSVAGIETARRGAAEASAQIPGSRVHELREPLREIVPGDPPELRSNPLAREVYMLPSEHDTGGMLSGGPPAIAAGGEFDDRIAGAPLDAKARAALADGKAVVFDRGWLTDGKVVFEASTEDGAAMRTTLPAHVAKRDGLFGMLPGALLTAETARKQGWDVGVVRLLVTYPPSTDVAAIDRAVAAAQRTGAEAWFDEGPAGPEGGVLAAIGAIAALVTLIGVAISVALSAAEGRADLATLAAVGAEPRRRRVLAACQALLIAGIGCALGVMGGTFVAFTARATTGSPDFVVPWPNLLATAIAVPLLAVLVAALFTPSRLPLVRRAT